MDGVEVRRRERAGTVDTWWQTGSYILQLSITCEVVACCEGVDVPLLEMPDQL
jgi:hypothetical protein